MFLQLTLGFASYPVLSSFEGYGLTENYLSFSTECLFSEKFWFNTYLLEKKRTVLVQQVFPLQLDSRVIDLYCKIWVVQISDIFNTRRVGSLGPLMGCSLL